MRRNEKKENVIKLQKDGRGNKVAKSHYQRKHTLKSAKKRASEHVETQIQNIRRIKTNVADWDPSTRRRS